MIAALTTQSGAFESSSAGTSALTQLPESVYRSLPSAADVIVTCVDHVVEAIRHNDVRALKAWVAREKHPASDGEILAVFDAVAHAVAFQSGDVKKMRRTLAFLGELRDEVRTDLAVESANERTDNMISPELHDVADGLLSAMQAYDGDTADHLRQTAVLARRIAQLLDLEPQQIADIELGALLHDVGKIAVPLAVLQKAGALTDAEWAVMREHPGTGAEMIERVEKLSHVAHIVRSHHERMDGRGYPDRLAGEEIPLEARVVAVADAFHAMVTTRSYREAMSAKAALDILHQNRDTQFDGHVVDAICEHFSYVPRAKPRPVLQSVLRGA